MDQHPRLHDEKLASHSNSINNQEGWGGCNLKQHRNYDFGCHGHLWGSFQWQHGLQMDLSWMWWWFDVIGCSNCVILGAACPIPTWCALCRTSNWPSCFGFRQVVLGWAHWKYAIVFVCCFFCTFLRNFGVCEPCQNIGDKGLEVVAQHQNPLNIHA